ncbi:hypothetical protein Tco_0811327 [Tanacetum coccineum]
MRISRFMYGITNPELIKRLHDNIPKSVDKIMQVTATFLRGEVAASNQERKKTLSAWKQQEDIILMSAHLKRQIEELIKNGKLSHVIKELKQGSGKDQPKTAKKGETSRKDKPLAILMGMKIGAEGPMIIEAEIGGHFKNQVYVDRGSASKILYEHCFNRPRPKVTNQMVPATAPLIGFSREIIWTMGQILMPVKIGDAEHFTSTWMNFVVVRSPSPYNGIIGRPGVRKIQAVPSTAHEMLKFPVQRGMLTLRSSRIIPLECTMVSGPEAQPSDIIQAAEERIKVAINLEYPEQIIVIGSTLIEEGRKALCDLHRRNLDIFAWKPTDMEGVPRHIAEHRLNMREGCSPVKQKKRSQTPKRNKAIQEEQGKRIVKGKGLFSPNGGRGRKVEVRFDNFGGGAEEVGNYGGNGGRGSSIFGRGGGSLAIGSMVRVGGAWRVISEHMERFYAPPCFRILNIENDLQTKSEIQRDMLLLAIGVPTKEKLETKKQILLIKGKELFGPNGGRGGKVELGFDNFGGGGEETGNCGGNGGRGSSIFGRGGGSLAICSMELKDGLGGRGLIVVGGRSSSVGAGGGEVKGGGVDFGVTKSLLGETPGENTRESGGDKFRVDGVAV